MLDDPRYDTSILTDFFVWNAERDTDRPAIIFGDVTLTHGELHNLAEPVAGYIHETVPKGGLIGIWAAPAVSSYVSIVATWMALRGYVPLDPAWPQSRLEQVLKASGISHVVHGDAVADQAAATLASCHVELVALNTLAAHERFTWDIPDLDDTAYVLFTSGTTGAPKGVPITYGNLSAFLNAFLQLDFELTENDRVLQMADLTFDLSIMSFVPAWAAGGAIVPVTGHGMKFLEVAALAEQHRITVLPVVPSLLALLTDYLDDLSLPDVRLLFACAEPFQAVLAQTISPSFPNAAIYNFYGPTEGGILATTHRWNAHEETAGELVPIGKPVPGMEIMLRPSASGSELLISGLQVFHGYLDGNNPLVEMDHRHWYPTGDIIDQLPDGTLLFRSRNDRQVQLGGHRVELDEVEQKAGEALQEQVTASVQPNDTYGQLELTLYYQSESISEAAARERLRSVLTPWQQPHHVINHYDRGAYQQHRTNMNALMALASGPDCHTAISNAGCFLNKQSAWPDCCVIGCDVPETVVDTAKGIATTDGSHEPRFILLLAPGFENALHQVLLANGLLLTAGHQLMSMQLPFEPPAQQADLYVERITTNDQLADWLEVAGSHFGQLNQSQFEQLMAQPAVKLYSGSVAGRVVATALTYTSNDVIGLYHVNVAEAFRRRGFARAISATALAEAPAGTKRAICQATEQAVGAYSALGMQPEGQMLVYWRTTPGKSPYFASHGEPGNTGSG